MNTIKKNHVYPMWKRLGALLLVLILVLSLWMSAGVRVLRAEPVEPQDGEVNPTALEVPTNLHWRGISVPWMAEWDPVEELGIDESERTVDTYNVLLYYGSSADGLNQIKTDSVYDGAWVIENELSANGEGYYAFDVQAKATEASGMQDSEIAKSDPVFFGTLDVEVQTLDEDGTTDISDTETGGSAFLQAGTGGDSMDDGESAFLPSSMDATLTASAERGYIFKEMKFDPEPTNLSVSGKQATFNLDKSTTATLVFQANSERVPVVIEFGDKHAALAQQVLAQIQDDAAYTASLEGSTLTINWPLADSACDPADYITEIVLEAKGSTWKGIDEGEEYENSIGLKPYDQYADMQEWLDETNSLGDVDIAENLKLYIHWAKPAETASFTIEPLVCGTEVKVEGEFPQQAQTPSPNVTADAESQCQPGRQANWYKTDDPNQITGGSDNWFTGTVKGGDKSYTGFLLAPSFGYFIDDDNPPAASVNGEEVELKSISPYTPYGPTYYVVMATLDVEHDWEDEGEVTQNPTATEMGEMTYKCRNHNSCSGERTEVVGWINSETSELGYVNIYVNPTYDGSGRITSAPANQPAVIADGDHVVYQYRANRGSIIHPINSRIQYTDGSGSIRQDYHYTDAQSSNASYYGYHGFDYNAATQGSEITVLTDSAPNHGVFGTSFTVHVVKEGRGKLAVEDHESDFTRYSGSVTTLIASATKHWRMDSNPTITGDSTGNTYSYRWNAGNQYWYFYTPREDITVKAVFTQVDPMVTVELGEGHAQLAAGFAAYLNGESGVSGCDAEADGTRVILYPDTSGVTIGRMQQTLAGKLSAYLATLDPAGEYNKEKILSNPLGQKTIDQYDSAADVDSEIVASTGALGMNQTYYALWDSWKFKDITWDGNKAAKANYVGTYDTTQTKSVDCEVETDETDQTTITYTATVSAEDSPDGQEHSDSYTDYKVFNLYVQGVHVTGGNCDNIPVTEGKVSYDPASNTLTLDNATIEMSRRSYGFSGDKQEYGIRSNLGSADDMPGGTAVTDPLTIKLIGENKIVNNEKDEETTNKFGIVVTSTPSVTYTGGGSLSVSMTADESDRNYIGIEVHQSTTFDGVTVDVNIDGTAGTVNAMRVISSNTISLTNGTEMHLDVENGYAVDSNSNSNQDLSVAKDCVLEAISGWDNGALHGNNWIQLTDDTKARGALVNADATKEGARKWDSTTDFSNYKYVKIPYEHHWGDWVTVEPTCTEKGSKTRTCASCDEKEVEEIPAIGHKWDAGKVTKEATCKEEGVKTYTCTVCHETKTEKIAKVKAHDWSAWKVTKKATEKAVGEEQRVCSICGEVEKRAIPKLTPAVPKPSGTLLAKATASGTKALKIQWTKVKNVDGYDIFLTKCRWHGKESPFKKIKTVKGNKTFTFTKKGLKKQTSYKLYVKAYVMKNGKKTYVRTSPQAHAFTSGYSGKETNARSLSIKKTAVSLKKGKSYTIKASVSKVKKNKKLMVGHVAKLRYMSTNKKVATVNKSGKITAKGKGTCNVYVYTHNGIWKTVKVTVK